MTFVIGFVLGVVVTLAVAFVASLGQMRSDE